jgi:hypothetical protein
MATHGFNLKQTRDFENRVLSLREKIALDIKYKEKVLQNGKEYSYIKKYFEDHLSFLRYTNETTIDRLYRVRKLEDSIPFLEKSELIYPPPNSHHKDRMNNMSSRVLYVSLHEYTAMAETRINNSYIGKYFQLTKFGVNREFTVFKIGEFNTLYKDTPRDSEAFKAKMHHYFGHSLDSTIEGYAALECAIADILYDQKDDYHILSSIMADAIFTTNPSVEAIMYPSVQNRYGTNLALKKELADELIIKTSLVNKLEDVYRNGFFKYSTLKQIAEIKEDTLIFSDVVGTCRYR